MENEPTEASSTQFSFGRLIGGKFKLEDKIGQGSFGMIFKCINQENQEPCAIKLEKRNQRHSSMLVREIKVMMEVKNEKGFARLNGYGKEDEYNYVAMTYLGRNLDSLLRKCGGKFKLPCLLNIFEQSLIRVQTLHSKNLIHRDIKPENFVIGYGSNYNQIHLIDFGLAKYYIDSEGNHIPFFEKKGMIGTARYASVNAHLGHEQSRRDDLEGLGYIILYFAKGQLPWQSIHAENKEEKYEKIKQMKVTISIEQLCQNLPVEFQQYFQHIKNLQFTEKPNYEELFKLIDKMRLDNNIENNPNIVDWAELPEYRQRKKFQTFTPQMNNQYQKRIQDEMGASPRQFNHRISDSQGIKQSLPRIQRKAQHNHTNLLQIPMKDGTVNIQPSLTNISANTSKMNNFSPGSMNEQNKWDQRKHVNSSSKIPSIGDFEKYYEEEKHQSQSNNNNNNNNINQSQKNSFKKSQNLNNTLVNQSQDIIQISQSNNIIQNNLINSSAYSGDLKHKLISQQNLVQQQNKASQQQDKFSGYDQSNKNTDNKNNNNKINNKQQEFINNSENMGTTDYHTQYPINVLVIKKSYKNGQFP